MFLGLIPEVFNQNYSNSFYRGQPNITVPITNIKIDETDILGAPPSDRSNNANIHEVLNVAEYLPVVGEVADAINGLLYAKEGKFGLAAISMLAAYPLGDIGKSSNWTVYGLKNSNNELIYVGRTQREVQQRVQEHYYTKSWGKEIIGYDILQNNLTYTQARQYEQYFINMYGMKNAPASSFNLNNGGILYNQYNSISPAYWSEYKIPVFDIPSFHNPNINY